MNPDLLGKVHNVDCLEFMRKLPDACIDSIICDPPYGMDYQSSRRTDKYEKIENDVTLEWFLPWAKECHRIMKDNTHFYAFCNDYAVSHFRDWLEEAGFTPKRALVWVKNNHTSGDLEGDYGNKTEFAVFAHKGRRLLNGGRDTNVINSKREATDFHPTQKPVDLMSFLIEKSTAKDEIVFDPFAGSGTTLVAAKQLGRQFLGCELSKKYCDITNERLRQDYLF